jgi:hypothetical protein
MANKPKTYVGINNEINGGMTSIGKVIRDGWVFGLLDESETCEGWNLAGIDALLQRVNTEWDKYGLQATLIKGLPNFQAIYSTKRDLPQPVGPLIIIGIRTS